jgi:inner membrane protein
VASLGHIAVGLAAARAYGTPPRSWLKAALLWSLLSMLPDADVIGFGFGVRYGDEWGHRGATHSLAFSCALGAAIGLAASRFGLPLVRTALTASLVLASHALLDTLTDGGLGCALLWPLDRTRYFAPWNPIPVAPIGLAFFSPYGMTVAAVELVLFAPLLWFALRRGGRRDDRL